MEEGFKVPIFPAKPPTIEETADSDEISEKPKPAIEIPYRSKNN
jgi:hypothetical protein